MFVLNIRAGNTAVCLATKSRSSHEKGVIKTRILLLFSAGEQLTTASNHAMVEVAEYKAKLRKLRQQLEEKTEQWSEVREEVEKLQETTDKLKSENLELCQDARAAKTYRDELDVLRERAEKVSWNSSVNKIFIEKPVLLRWTNWKLNCCATRTR